MTPREEMVMREAMKVVKRRPAPNKYGEPSVVTGSVFSGAHAGVFYVDDTLGCCYGKITSTDDLVTFESDSIEDVEVAFVEAVEGYERTRAELE